MSWQVMKTECYPCAWKVYNPETRQDNATHNYFRTPQAAFAEADKRNKWDEELKASGKDLVDGDLVKYSDYAALEAENAKLRELLEGLSTIIHHAEAQGFQISDEDDAVWSCSTEYLEAERREK